MRHAQRERACSRNDTTDFERLTRALDPGMTLHGVAMVGAGVTLGYAIAKAGVLPKWTGALLGVGVLLVPLTAARAPVLELTAVAVRDLAIAAMGVAILSPGRRPA